MASKTKLLKASISFNDEVFSKYKELVFECQELKKENQKLKDIYKELQSLSDEVLADVDVQIDRISDLEHENNSQRTDIIVANIKIECFEKAIAENKNNQEIMYKYYKYFNEASDKKIAELDKKSQGLKAGNESQDEEIVTLPVQIERKQPSGFWAGLSRIFS